MALSIRTILILVAGLILVATVLGMWGGLQSDTENSIGSSTDQSEGQSDKANCVAACRFDYPSGGAEFENCKKSC